MMASKYLMLAFCAVATLSSLESVNGKYRISWITKDDTNAGTNHWVGFELFTADGEKTAWMWPDESFDRGIKGTADMDEPSIGDIAKVNLHIQRIGAHDDDWKPYQVVVSDSVNKKTYQAFPSGWIPSGGYKKFTVTARQCSNIYPNPSSNCLRGGNLCGLPPTGSGATSYFNAAKTDFYGCLKICDYCYPADSDEPEEQEDKEGEQPNEDPSGDHEKKSSSNKKNEENN